MLVSIFSTNFSLQGKFGEILSYIYMGLHAKYQLILSYFNQTFIFSTSSKSPQIPNVMQIRPMGAEMFHAGGRAGGQRDIQTDRYDEVNNFLNFANALKMIILLVFSFTFLNWRKK